MSVTGGVGVILVFEYNKEEFEHIVAEYVTGTESLQYAMFSRDKNYLKIVRCAHSHSLIVCVLSFTLFSIICCCSFCRGRQILPQGIRKGCFALPCLSSERGRVYLSNMRACVLCLHTFYVLLAGRLSFGTGWTVRNDGAVL